MAGPVHATVIGPFRIKYRALHDSVKLASFHLLTRKAGENDTALLQWRWNLRNKLYAHQVISQWHNAVSWSDAHSLLTIHTCAEGLEKGWMIALPSLVSTINAYADPHNSCLIIVSIWSKGTSIPTTPICLNVNNNHTKAIYILWHARPALP